ncbi:peptidyl-prolyl cis-trans isomerase CYP71 [Artemisia annua]|uniref:Peptidyl-prolyl cis-trans isomerase CYP71 n=1 Tax=Artemisia annua TaxID=35608 RepID=A0A2U1NX01_ARTAN|nr:peptidyl-prolyl cis-trans isomerase CYP71 [Artemisia annua]
MDAAQAIQKVKTDKGDKPYQNVKILNVTVPKRAGVFEKLQILKEKAATRIAIKRLRQV